MAPETPGEGTERPRLSRGPTTRCGLCPTALTAAEPISSRGLNEAPPTLSGLPPPPAPDTPSPGGAAAASAPQQGRERAQSTSAPRTSVVGLSRAAPALSPHQPWQPPGAGAETLPAGRSRAVRPAPHRPAGPRPPAASPGRRHFVCVGSGGASSRPRPPEMAPQVLGRALVTAKWLSEAVRAGRVGPSLRVLDASWYPPQERNARQEFKERHIPGASFFDIEECRDKSSPYDFMLPSPSHFADYVGRLGVGSDTHVVVYDGDELGTFYAPRAWWMFRVFGHKEVSVLNGGFKNWVKEGHPVTAEVSQPEPAVFKARLNTVLVKTFEEMVQNVGSLRFQVVDSRPEGRFRGTELDQGNGGGNGTYPLRQSVMSVHTSLGLMTPPSQQTFS